jgi:hypothetical protein
MLPVSEPHQPVPATTRRALTATWASADFGWRSYLFSEGVEPVFGSLGDTLNHLVINTTGSSAGDVYRRTAAIVTTGDATVFGHVRSALGAAGLGDAVNLDGYAPSLLPHQDLSTFAVLHRASVFANASDKVPYFNQSTRVVMLTPPHSQPASPLPLLPLRKRGTGTSEAAVPGLTAALAQLKASIVARFAARNASLTAESPIAPRVLNGRECIREREQCLGDNQDANYLHSNASSLPAGVAAVLVGSNCVANGKCTYTAAAPRTSCGSLTARSMRNRLNGTLELPVLAGTPTSASIRRR